MPSETIEAPNEGTAFGKKKSRSPFIFAALLIMLLLVVGIGTFFAVNAAVNDGASNEASRARRSLTTYMDKRSKLLEEDQSRRFGAKMVLSDKEKQLDEFIRKVKKNMIETSRLNNTEYYPALHFYQSKEMIDSSPILKIIKKMPKGAALHVHDLAMTSLDWVVSNATYRDHVYMCTDDEGYIQLAVFKTPPSRPDCPWKSVHDERAKAASAVEFDASIKKSLSLLGKDPRVEFPTIGKIWERFNKYFDQVSQLMTYAPIMRDYFRQGLEEFREDNVQYLEFRALLLELYELDGTTHNKEYTLLMYRSIAEQFVKEHPDFTGAKTIFTSLRSQPKTDIMTQVKLAIEFYNKYPDFFLGFDLVGQEDPNYSLLYYIQELLYPSEFSLKLPYFYHAAETNWLGTKVDYNLVDAILLNTTRIGHGYALVKHPKLAELVKARGIAVEVNPISNQVLGLVLDIRNHGIVPLMADDFPIVISSDDPGTWDALPLSHDYFIALMDMAREDDALAFLKQLAVNSIKYSAMSTSEKAKAMSAWQRKWDAFIQQMETEWQFRPV